MPEAPFATKEPPLPSPTWKDKDLRTAPEDELRVVVDRLAHADAYPDAAIVQRWLVERHADGTMYNLACYEARAGHLDAAVHWLRTAAREEGVGAAWASKDEDLVTVRDDPRWPALFSYLTAMNTYWTKSGIERAARFVPRGTAPAGGFPLVIGLHGYGGNEAFLGAGTQSVADRAGAAFLSLSATIPQGPRQFEWAEDLTRDGARIDRGIAELTKTVAVDPKRRVTMGFSQGGATAAMLLAQTPDAFAGAIVFSPGSMTGLHPEDPPSPNRLRAKSVVIRVGAGESHAMIANALALRDYFVKSGARVDYYAYPEQQSHTLPMDYEQKIVSWVSFASGGAAAGAPPVGRDR
jgi:predicted esterase